MPKIATAYVVGKHLLGAFSPSSDMKYGSELALYWYVILYSSANSHFFQLFLCIVLYKAWVHNNYFMSNFTMLCCVNKKVTKDLISLCLSCIRL